MSGGGRLARIDTSDDDDVNVGPGRMVDVVVALLNLTVAGGLGWEDLLLLSSGRDRRKSAKARSCKFRALSLARVQAVNMLCVSY